jgi:thymidylate synthase (FAD)
MSKIEVYDGFVEYIGHYGSDQLIANVARESWQSEGDGESNEQLVRKLLDLGHTSPFEFASMHFRLECPIFVQRQIMRHRIASYLERSLRYVVPSDLKFFDQGEPELYAVYDQATEVYYTMLDRGERPGYARSVLPMGTYTVFQMKMNLRSLLNFFDLRCSDHAQPETASYAWAMQSLTKSHFPVTMEWWWNKSKGDKNEIK